MLFKNSLNFTVFVGMLLFASFYFASFQSPDVLEDDEIEITSLAPISNLSRCTSNPFLSFITPTNFDIYEAFALKHRLKISKLGNKVRNQSVLTWSKLWPVIPGSCDGHIKRVGPPNDGGKNICGLDQMDSTNCIIFSLGSNGDWSFERNILRYKKGCRTVTFDCTGHFTVPKAIEGRAIFRHQCYGVQNLDQGEGKLLPSRNIQTMMNENDVTQLHLLKMDIENSEYDYFFDMFENTPLEKSKHLPNQILLEIHFEWGPPTMDKLVPLLEGLYDFGYRVVFREANVWCKTCYELTLLRFRC